MAPPPATPAGRTWDLPGGWRGVAQQARLDDLQGEGVIALADEGGSGSGELLFPASGQQVECGGVPGRGRRLESPPVWRPVTGALVVEPLGEWSRVTR